MKRVQPGPTVCVVGEGMLELRGEGGDWSLGYGGDTVNTAVHLAREGLDVRYATALGDDPLSDGLRKAWRDEGIDDKLVLTIPGRLPGLYAIHTDHEGERTFNYWRNESAARLMFEGPAADMLCERVGEVDLLYYSLISLAILPEGARSRLLSLCDRVRGGGGRVAFDGNYRARLWPDAAAARHVRDRALASCDIGLPTLADEIEIGDAYDAAGTLAHWQAAGVAETVVKLGREGCMLPDGTRLPPPAAIGVVDSSGAGDAFNAGYLAARLHNADAREAALRGHRLAGWTIGRPGAIPRRDELAPYPLPLPAR